METFDTSVCLFRCVKTQEVSIWSSRKLTFKSKGIFHFAGIRKEPSERCNFPFVCRASCFSTCLSCTRAQSQRPDDLMFLKLRCTTQPELPHCSHRRYQFVVMCHDGIECEALRKNERKIKLKRCKKDGFKSQRTRCD